MDCQELSKHIYDYCDDSVSPQMYLKVKKHLRDCPSCQQLYKLTRLENEVLRDTTDIPALSPDFTSRVMGSVGSVRRGAGLLYNRKFWYSGLAAVAVVALFLFMPQLLKNPAYVNIADKGDAAPDSVTPLVVSTPGNGATVEQLTVAEQLTENQKSAVQQEMAAAPRSGDESEAPSTPVYGAPADTFSPPSVLGTKQYLDADTIPGDSVPSQKSTAFQPEQDEILMLRALDTPISAPMATRNGSATVVEDIEPVRTPVNVPVQFQLMQVDISDGSRTVYDYLSQDGMSQLQIIVDPYIEPATQLQNLGSASTEGINNLSRWVLIEDEMVTVTYSGNVSMEVLTNLANTVRFQ